MSDDTNGYITFNITLNVLMAISAKYLIPDFFSLIMYKICCPTIILRRHYSFLSVMLSYKRILIKLIKNQILRYLIKFFSGTLYLQIF